MKSSSTPAGRRSACQAEITGGVGVPVVYDSIGQSTFDISLDCLARRGLMVCFGTASGPTPPIQAMQLAVKGSLFLTRPALADYIADPEERAEVAGANCSTRRIRANQDRDQPAIPLEDAVRAHHDMSPVAVSVPSVFSV
ncbi:unnamed protein product, partial [Mesorhabditis spiculigera]